MKTSWPQPAGPTELSADTLDVWAVLLGAEHNRLSELASQLTSDEQQRADEFRLDEPRRRYVVTRAALRELLVKYLGGPASKKALEMDRHGKPRVAGQRAGSDVRFNVAHSGDLALIAITAGCEVGVDVERVRPISHAEHIARRYLHPVEAEAIFAASSSFARDIQFLRCWTGKEAVLKAVGRGITGSLAAFRVPANEFRDAWILLPAQFSNEHSRCWLRPLTPCEGYVGAVACLGEERAVRCFEFVG
jgi:4'-phosphopantetheinyl transferase